jgi:hypothetical protein
MAPSARPLGAPWVRSRSPGSSRVPFWSPGAARSAGVPSRSAGRRRTARSPVRPPPSRASPSTGGGPRPDPVVTVPRIGVRDPEGVPEITRAPLRERPWLGLSLGRCAQTSQSQTCGNHCCCSKTCDVFHIAFLAKQAVNEISGSNKNRLTGTERVTCAMARFCGRLPLALGAPEDVAPLQLGGTNRRRAHPARLPGTAVHVGARPAGPVRRCAVVMPGAYHDDAPAT